MNRDNMKDLYTAMKDALIQRNKKIEINDLDFLNSDTESRKFIQTVLKDGDFGRFDNDAIISRVSEARPRHSAISYLMGLVFANFDTLYEDSIRLIDNNYANHYIWLLTALYHDCGYFSAKIKDAQLDFSSYEYDLLNDTGSFFHMKDFSVTYPNTMAYEYEEIKAYDTYARRYHAKPRADGKTSDERIDHGILGGYEMYNRLLRKYIDTDGESQGPVVVKACGITIAQHNMYKSENNESDDEYGVGLTKLHSTSSFRVSKETPLLMFLCLIDTVECIKKLGKMNNPKGYIETETVLKKVLLDVRKNKIVIDYGLLHKYIRNEKKNQTLENTFSSYITNVRNLGNWTTFHVQEVNGKPDIISIEIEENNGIQNEEVECSPIETGDFSYDS